MVHTIVNMVEKISDISYTFIRQLMEKFLETGILQNKKMFEYASYGMKTSVGTHYRGYHIQ